MNELKEIERLVDSMPDSLLKANFCALIGAHYRGPDAERRLNEILQDFVIGQLT